MASQSRPEPMNASSHHSKVKVTLALSDPVYVAGGHISGKIQVDNHVDLDSMLGIGVIMVELFATQEVNSGQYSATSTFIHSRRMFQGPGLPPSNAVYSGHVSGADEFSLPAHHLPARRGQTTFFFRFPLPASSPSSISFGPASVKYEIRASVSVAWKGDKRLVTDRREVKVVESWDPTNAVLSPQAVAITEGGKIWAQATLTNDMVVGGESARINLQLKNHTERWTSGVTVTLIRHLHLSQSFLAGRSPSDISDIATQVEFRGPEYSVPPGIEGMASLVVDIPRHSRGVKGGQRVDDNGKATEGFFEIRCTLSLRIEMPSGSEDNIISLPLTIYHSLAVPETPPSLPHLSSSPYPYTASGLLSPPLGAALLPIHTGSQTQPYDPSWISPTRPISKFSPNQQPEQGNHNWRDVSHFYGPSMPRSTSVGPLLQAPSYTPRLSTSYAPSLRLLPPAPWTSYISHPAAPTETIGSYTDTDHLRGAQNFQLAPQHRSVSPRLRSHPSQTHVQNQPRSSSRVLPSPIDIPPLPNPHDSQGVLHSPRPVPSPKQSFYGSVPKSDNVSKLERMADEVEKQTGDLTLNLPKGDAGLEADIQGLKRDRVAPAVSLDKTLPVPPVPSSKGRHLVVQRPPRVDTVFTTEQGPMTNPCDFPSTPHLPRAPPTPPMAAITPIKFPKAPTELSGLGANLGKDVPPESGLDALERRLLAEVGTRKLDDPPETRPLRSIAQPITIPPSGAPPDTANDSAISSLTLADREEGILRASQDREHEQDRDRDSDERTQHMSGGHSQSEDDRDARTQKGKSDHSRKLGKSKNKSRHGTEEDLERPGRRRERKKTKDGEGRKLRQEARGRVAAWLGEIDVSVPPALDDPPPSSFLASPTASHFMPVAESTLIDPAPAEVRPPRGGDVDIATDKDVSASPNPRSSGFVTISSLKGSDGKTSSKPSLRRSSFNGIHPAPPSPPHPPTTTTTTTQRPALPRSPSAAEVKRSAHVGSEALPQTRPAPARLLFWGGRQPRWPSSKPNPADPEVKYDVQSARGGRGGQVTQVASLWATKVDKANPNASANAKVNVGIKARKAGVTLPVPVPSYASAVKKSTSPTSPPPVRKPVMNANMLKRGLVFGGGAGLNRIGVGGEMGLGLNGGLGGGVGMSMGVGAREGTKTTKATTVPAVLSSSHAVPMLSSTASLARTKVHGPGQVQGQARSLPPMITETISDARNVGGGAKTGGGGQGQGQGQGRALGDLAFGQARLRDLIKKYQG